MAEIIIEGLDKVQRTLGKLTGPQMKRTIRTASRKIGEQAQSRMQQAPGMTHSPVIWASEKQRRWYFAMRREAKLDPRYVREKDQMSQRLLRSWKERGKRYGDVGFIVGTNVFYAPYVQSAEMQTEQHAATGWKTDKQVVEELERSGIIRKIVETEIDSLLRSL